MDNWQHLLPMMRFEISSENYNSLRFYLFIFRESGKEWDRAGEKGRETSMCKRNINQLPFPRSQQETWPTTQECAWTRNQTGDLLVCWTMPNPLSHTSQGKNFNFENCTHWCDLVSFTIHIDFLMKQLWY